MVKFTTGKKEVKIQNCNLINKLHIYFEKKISFFEKSYFEKSADDKKS